MAHASTRDQWPNATVLLVFTGLSASICLIFARRIHARMGLLVSTRSGVTGVIAGMDMKVNIVINFLQFMYGLKAHSMCIEL